MTLESTCLPGTAWCEILGLEAMFSIPQAAAEIKLVGRFWPKNHPVFVFI